MRVADELGWDIDPDTLREVARAPAELTALRAELTGELDGVDEDAEPARVAELAGRRAVLSRALGDLDLALADGHRALAAAQRADDPGLVAVARARLAHVHQWRGEYGDSDALYEQCLAEAAALPAGLRAALHQHAGQSCYDQQRYAEAAEHFAEAVRLRQDGDPALLDAAERSLAAARRQLP
jgi:tetratricopeptide (TPR) repeat protein